jgi:F-type H+-transporting ATPase subunit b
MSIDWLTVAAQLVNFIILVWLLRRFLFIPVGQAMARRQQTLQATRDEASRKEAAAEAARQKYEAACQELEQQRTHRLQAIEQEAEKLRQALLQQARDEDQALRQRLQQQQLAWKNHLDELAQVQLGQLLAFLLERLCADLASMTLHEAMVARCTEQLKALPQEWRSRTQGQGNWRLVCARPLRDIERWHLQDAIVTALAIAPPAVAVDDTLLAGLALEGPNDRLAWNLREALGDALREWNKTQAARQDHAA